MKGDVKACRHSRAKGARGLPDVAEIVITADPSLPLDPSLQRMRVRVCAHCLGRVHALVLRLLSGGESPGGAE
jgi:hypothetical protein